MAVALLGYFTTMVTAFVGFMFLLSSILSSSFVQQAHLRRPYPTPAVIAAATVPEERQPAMSAQELARAETAKQADEDAAKETTKQSVKEAANPATAEKSKRAKLAARSQRRKQDFASRQQDRDYARQQEREYSMALGYAQDGQRQYGGGPFGGGQFGGGQFGGMFGQFGTRRF